MSPQVTAVTAVTEATTPSRENLNSELIVAASKLDAERVGALLKEGASAAYVHDPEGVWGSCDRKSALHAALEASHSLGSMQEFGCSIVETLIAAKADVNAQRKKYDWRGCGSSLTAFEMALPSAMQDVKLLELFLNAGADANTKSVRDVHSMRTDGRSIHYVLHKAVKAGSLEVVRALLDAGAKVDAVSSDIYHNERGYNSHTEETALQQACRAGNLPMVALLLARGAAVDFVRKELEQEDSGEESLTDDPREEDFVSSVICVPVKETALHIAIRQKDANMVMMLVCAGADATIPRVRGDVESTPEELCASDEALLNAIRAEWTPETHRLFPADVREGVRTALLIAQRQKWPLPDAILFRAFAMASGPPAMTAGCGLDGSGADRE